MLKSIQGQNHVLYRGKEIYRIEIKKEEVKVFQQVTPKMIYTLQVMKSTGWVDIDSVSYLESEINYGKQEINAIKSLEKMIEFIER